MFSFDGTHRACTLSIVFALNVLPNGTAESTYNRSCQPPESWAFRHPDLNLYDELFFALGDQE